MLFHHFNENKRTKYADYFASNEDNGKVVYGQYSPKNWSYLTLFQISEGIQVLKYISNIIFC